MFELNLGLYSPEGGWGGGILSYISFMGVCCCKGYGFQAALSGIGYRKQRTLV